MNKVRAKKSLGQHFLKNEEIANEIVESFFDSLTGQEVLNNSGKTKKFNVLEIGPGMGVLTKYILEKTNVNLFLAEIDMESVAYLCKNFPLNQNNFIVADFLQLDFEKNLKNEQVSVIGNFPYNISSQILFKVFENKEQVPLIVGMFQKEVAKRIASPPGSKEYGILSVLLQAFYDVEYLFTVDEWEFSPAPKVKSAVIKITRNADKKLSCNLKNFKTVVKTAFNQRRKTLRNSLKSLTGEIDTGSPIFSKRPEQLSVEEFTIITKLIFNE